MSKLILIGILFLTGCPMPYSACMGKCERSRPLTQQTQEYVVPSEYDSDGYGIPVYKADECVGPIVNGVCHGGVIPKSAWQTKCYGQMLNGECTGPMF